MRIRKNAKTSSKNYNLLQTHLCQLNQSPWDAFISPSDSSTAPSPYQLGEDDSFIGNGSLGDSIGDLESIASMKISMEGDDYCDIEEEHKPIFCSNTDGRGWECGMEAEEGHFLCEFHLAHLKNCNTWAHPDAKKSDKPTQPAKNRAVHRAKKSKSESNPYEIYYYSGFGPRWGKKRGAEKSDEPAEVVEKAEAAAAMPCSSNSSRSGAENFENLEEDDDETSIDGNGKERTRKPIKARSLKSLM